MRENNSAVWLVYPKKFLRVQVKLSAGKFFWKTSKISRAFQDYERKSIWLVFSKLLYTCTKEQSERKSEKNIYELF